MLTTKPNVSTPLEYRMDSAVKPKVKLKTKTKHYISEACLHFKTLIFRHPGARYFGYFNFWFMQIYPNEATRSH